MWSEHKAKDTTAHMVSPSYLLLPHDKTNLVLCTDQSYSGSLFCFTEPKPILRSQLLGMKAGHSLLKIPACLSRMRVHNRFGGMRDFG